MCRGRGCSSQPKPAKNNYQQLPKQLFNLLKCQRWTEPGINPDHTTNIQVMYQ